MLRALDEGPLKEAVCQERRGGLVLQARRGRDEEASRQLKEEYQIDRWREGLGSSRGQEAWWGNYQIR